MKARVSTESNVNFQQENNLEQSLPTGFHDI